MTQEKPSRPPTTRKQTPPTGTPSSQRKEGFRSRQERQEAAEDRLAMLERKMPGLGPRRAAIDVLTLIRKGRNLDQALQQCRTFNVLEGADRGLARNLVSTTLRQRGALDEIIGQYLERPLPAKSLEIQDILRLAAAQSLFLEIPPHAAVATAVELAGEKRETAGYKKLVNAIARKISDKGPEKLQKLPARVNTPGWLWRSWERAYGPARTREIALAHQAQAALDLSLKPDSPAGLIADLIEELEGAERLIADHVRLAPVSDVTALPGFREGHWWVQDLAASLPVRLLGSLKDRDVLDLCAAPGGKTLQLAAAGARVTALDISGPRMKRVEENLARTGLEAQLVTADVQDWQPEASFDAILLDAPCSATGTIRRNPDVIWAKTEDEVRQLAKLQAKFIDRALTFLKPGGSLVYCVCSLQREEGEDQVKAALARHQGALEQVPVTPEEIGGLPGLITKDGNLRCLSSSLADKGGMDGFFAAKFVKTDSTA